MKNRYAIDVLTNKSLDADQFAGAFLEAWLDGNPKLRPERFGHGEPARHPITDIEQLLAEWRKPPALMFKRATAPRFIADVSWREDKGQDPRPYPWGVRVWLDRTAGDGLTLEFFEFLIRWFEPAFARVTTVEEGNRKHFAVYPLYEGGKVIGTAEQFVGADVTNKLPGIYWLTYLSGELLDSRALRELEDKVLNRDARGGVIIRSHANSTDIGSAKARSAENEIIDRLGVDRFFSVDQWMRERSASA